MVGSSEDDYAGGETGIDGDRPGERSIRLSVPEMDCPSCAGKVGNGLQRVEGVLETDLQPTTGTAIVTYDPARTDDRDVVSAIEGAGYSVVDRPGDSRADDDAVEIAPPSNVWRSDRAIKTWIGAVFLVAGLALEFIFAAWNLIVIPTPVFAFSLADIAFIIAILTSGVPVVRSGYYSARNRSLDIDLLMGTAIVAASSIGLFIEAATLAVLFSIAELLERYAMDRTRNSLRELIELAPEEATVRRNGIETTVPVDELSVGEIVIVRPGEKIPVDGTVAEGESAVDQSPITGESVPVDKTPGDEVYAGSLNTDGYLELETTTEADGTTLAQIVDLVRQAQAKTTRREQFVDRFAGYYTPIVVVLAILTVLLPPVLIDGTATLSAAGFSHTFIDDRLTWFVRGLTLLVIACPCAFVISTPVSVASGVTAAARNGVLIKGGNHLEAMGEIHGIAFDKTGTLTKGELAVTDVVPVGSATESEVLRRAAALEQRSEHPIAEAVLDRAAEESIETPEVTGFEGHAGRGVSATIDGTTHYVGNPGFFDELGVELGEQLVGESDTPGFDDEGPKSDGGMTATDTSEADPAAVYSRLQAEGKTVVLVGTDEEVVGMIGIADEIRPAAKRAIETLHKQGVGPLVMLTGDNEGTARAVAAELGIDEYHAELLPEEKVEAIEALEAEHGRIAMVGDGINDAPALAASTVGIAMGAAGTDTAIETADIALMGDELETLPYLTRLSRRANGVIRQNIWSSLGVKFLLAIGVPFGYVSVAIAVVVGDMGMSLGVTGNAMRLARLAPERFAE